MDKHKKQAFTLVELIITITIIAILSTIGFNSYVGYLGDARDSERKANMGEIKTSLKLYKQKRGAYPLPGDTFNITNSGVLVAIQGKLNEDVTLNTMDKIPTDPYTNKYYFYSVVTNKQEAQVALTLENGDFPMALLDGDYKTVSKNILPSIVLATGATSSVEIHTGVLDGSSNRNLFILDGGKNLPYNITKPNDVFYAGENIDDVLAGGNVKFWQNSDYRTCDEISEAAKFIHNIGSEQYQIADDTGYLVNTGCIIRWMALDSNCDIPDITIGSQTWAGCNSTLGTGIEYSVDQNCYNYVGGATTGCNRLSNEKESVYNATYGINNIWGKLYTWANSSSACPSGRHVPSFAEWTTLGNYLSGTTCGVGDWWQCDGLGWKLHNTKTTSNNMVQALKLPLAGNRNSDGVTFNDRGSNSFLWSSTPVPSTGNAFNVYLYRDLSAVNRYNDSQAYSFSVRCLRD